MNDDAFLAFCRDPASPARSIERRIRERPERLLVAAAHIPDDEKCARVVGQRVHFPYMFRVRTLEFYRNHKVDVFRSWRPTNPHLWDVLVYPDGAVDIANKVAYVLETATSDVYESDMWPYILYVGMQHRDEAVRRMFTVRAPHVAAFLLHFPPRVQCRVLDAAVVADE